MPKIMTILFRFLRVNIRLSGGQFLRHSVDVGGVGQSSKNS